MQFLLTFQSEYVQTYLLCILLALSKFVKAYGMYWNKKKIKLIINDTVFLHIKDIQPSRWSKFPL